MPDPTTTFLTAAVMDDDDDDYDSARGSHHIGREKQAALAAAHTDPELRYMSHSGTSFGKHATLKSIGNIAKSGASMGVNVTANAMGTTTVVGLAVGGTVAGIGTGGIALLAAGGALMLGSSAQAGRSAYKTHQHIKSLSELAARKLSFPCSNHLGHDHLLVANEILGYIVTQKRKKLVKKSTKVVPVLGGSSVSAHAVYRNIRKRLQSGRQGLGGERTYNAQMLAHHHVDEDCALTTAIIAELFRVSVEAAKSASLLDKDALAHILSRKIKSK